MKYVISLLTIFLFASHLFAQQPTISYLMADEAKSQLQIHGSFGIDSGSVSIEDTTLGIVSWSDSLIICNLPDSGKGAGGHVEVQTIHGMSNKRALSIFSMTLYHEQWYIRTIGGKPIDSTPIGNQKWVISWRFDIGQRILGSPKSIPFEISKISYGQEIGSSWIYGWGDTLFYTHRTISLSGFVDLSNGKINFKAAMLHLDVTTWYGAIDSIVYLTPISFDSIGNLTGYKRIYNDAKNYLIFHIDNLYSDRILFPPNPKSVVRKLFPTSYSLINISLNSKNQTIIFKSIAPLGPTTASLYTIDGRLLKRTKFDISAPGNYSIDVSDMHTRFAILVLQTSRGVITKKIIF